MLLELIKEAGKQDLSIEFKYEGNSLCGILIDNEANELLTVEATDSIFVFNKLYLFLLDPEGYVEDMRKEVADVSGLN